MYQLCTLNHLRSSIQTGITNVMVCKSLNEMDFNDNVLKSSVFIDHLSVAL